MPDIQIGVTRPDGSRATITATPELISKAIAKKWQVDDLPMRKPGPDGELVAISASKLPKALERGWALDAGDEPEATDALPDLPLAAEQQAPADGRWGVTLENVDQASYQASADEAAQQRFLQGLEAQKAEEARQAQLQQEHGAGLTTGRGLMNAAATTGEGLARGVSLGLDAPAAYIQAGAEQLAEAVGGPANPDVPRSFDASLQTAKQGIAGRTEANPVLATGSEIVGAVAPALASGGESLAARVLAKTPAGFAARKAAQYGLGAGARVALEAPGLAGSLLRVAAPAVKLGVEGGVQGGAVGAVSAANQLWMDNDAHTVAEYLAAMAEGGWNGAKTGLGLGVGLGTALGARAQSGGAEASEKFLRGQGLLRLPSAASESGSLAAGGESVKYTSPEQPDFVRRQVGKVAKITPEQVAKTRDAAHPGLVKKWNEFIGLREKLEELNVAAKRTWARRVAPEPARFSFSSVIDDQGLGLSKADLEAMANEGAVLHDGKGGAGQVKLLAKRLATLDSELMADDLTSGVSHGEVVSAIDQAKRDVDKVVAWAETRNKYLHEMLAPRAQQLREFLENEDAVGAALAKGQRDTNATWSPSISAQMDSALDSMEATAGVKKVGSYQNAGRVNDAWLSARLSGAGSNVEAQTENAVNRLLNTASDDALTRSSVYGSKESQAAAKRLATVRDELQTELGRVAEVNRSVAEASSTNIVVAGTQIPGSGYVRDLALNRVRRFAHKATVAAEQRINDAAEKATSFGSKPQRAVVTAAKLAQQREKIAASVESFYQQVASGDADAENARYVALLEQTFGPEMAAAEQARFTAQQQFLMAKAGDPNSPGFKTRFLRYAEPVRHPEAALDRAADGTATPEDRETLQAVHPQLWARFTRRVLERFDRSTATYDQRLRISQITGVPVDASLEPQRYQQHQQIAAQQAGQAAEKRANDQVVTPGNRKPPEVNEIVQP